MLSYNNPVFSFIDKMKTNADIYIFMTCKLNKTDIESTLGLKFPAVLFNNFTGGKDDIKTHYINDKIIILGGLGTIDKCSYENIRICMSNCIAQTSNIKNIASKTLLVFVNNINIKPIINSTILSLYTFNKYKTDNKSKTTFKHIYFYASSHIKENRQCANRCIVIGNSINLCRSLGNEPSNYLTTTSFSKYIQHRAKTANYTARILGLKEIKKLKMGGIIGVSQGSKYEPQFVIIKYNGGIKSQKPIVLIGKGVVFDSGGINIKTGDFDDMKTDMLGGACVLSIIDALSQLKVKKNIVGLIPLVENMTSATAMKPGDIIKSGLGKTIEVTNTDAEGRLILADALGYSHKLKPSLIIDMATLTGLADKITDNKASIILGNNNKVLNKLIDIGDDINDKVINMPIWRDFIDNTKSDIADYKNLDLSTNGGSTIYAGAFLSNFVPPKTDWVHIDLGGSYTTSSRYYNKQGCTGSGVNLVINYIEQLSY